MSHRPKTIVAWVSAVLVGAIVLFASWVAVDAAMMPDCARCHMTGEFAQQTSHLAHAGVECGGCHGGTTIGSRVVFGAAQVTGMYLGLVDLDPALASVSSGKCKACHASGITQVTETAGLRVKHSSCGVGRDCTDCHSPTAHGTATSWPRSATMELCYECHGQDRVSADCDLCHTARLPSERVTSATFSATHGPNYLETHGMGRMSTCSACHGSDRCAKCHGAGVPHPANFVTSHPESSNSSAAKCGSCHQENFCIDCHGYKMPHPARFTSEHSQIVEKDGEAGCRRCHAENDCVDCHVRHVHPTTSEQMDLLGITRPKGGGQ